MSASPKVYVDAMAVDVRLAALGLSAAILREAIVDGELARLACTANMPPGFRGVAAWAHTVTALRDRLIPLGWEKSDAGNYPVIIAPTRLFSIGVATGNEFTGIEHFTPKTKFPKGPTTIRRVESNQFDLFGEPVAIDEVVSTDPDHLTWLLLIARSFDGVRGELSLPSGVGQDDRVDQWEERIIFPITDPGEPHGGVRLPDPGPEFDVDVIRRAG